MPNYYNEIDPYAARWLRNLIVAGHIGDGDVDERSIVDVPPDDLKPYTQCHFFAGIGGWPYALRLAGWPDERPVWTGSCPCQPFSAAGKRGGFDDERHLWPNFRSLIAERRPSVVFGEQVASATAWLRLVRGDLEALDYAVGCCPVEAASAGADHLRDRYWFVAADGSGRRDGSRGWQGELARRAEAFGAGDSSRGAKTENGADAQGRQASTRNEQRVLGADGNRRSGGAAGVVVNAARNGRREGRPEHELRSGRAAASIAGGAIESGVGQADAHDARSQGRIVLRERAGERIVGTDGVAGSCSARTGRNAGAVLGAQAQSCGQGQPDGNCDQRAVADGAIEWVIGADGKARRVKSGIRLLVNGFPNRVAKLRAFGNAIVPQCAAQFIGAFIETENPRRING